MYSLSLSASVWVVMACPEILALRQFVSRITRVKIFCGAGSVRDEKHVLFDCPHIQPTVGDKRQSSRIVQLPNHIAWYSFFGRMILYVSQDISESLDVMLVPTLTIRFRQLISPIRTGGWKRCK
jgi:hypothetical protein